MEPEIFHFLDGIDGRWKTEVNGFTILENVLGSF